MFNFSFQAMSYERVFHVISEKKVKIDNIFKILSHMMALPLVIRKKQKTLQQLLIIENTRNNKQ